MRVGANATTRAELVYLLVTVSSLTAVYAWWIWEGPSRLWWLPAVIAAPSSVLLYPAILLLIAAATGIALVAEGMGADFDAVYSIAFQCLSYLAFLCCLLLNAAMVRLIRVINWRGHARSEEHPHATDHQE